MFFVTFVDVTMVSITSVDFYCIVLVKYFPIFILARSLVEDAGKSVLCFKSV